MSIVWGHYSVDSQGRPGGDRPDRACMQDIYDVREHMAVCLPNCYIYDILYYDADDGLQRKYSIRRTSSFSVLLLPGERIRIYAASSDPIDLALLQAVQFQPYAPKADFDPSHELLSARHIKLIGDSITAGSGGSGYRGIKSQFDTDPPVISGNENPQSFSWANLLKYRLEGMLDCEVKNWGTSKYPSLYLSMALPHLIQEEDELIFCTIGTNDRLRKGDTIQDFSDRIRSILAYCLAKGKRIVMMSPIPSSAEPSLKDLAYTISDVREGLRQVCQQAGVPFLDLHGQFQAELEGCGLPLDAALSDGLHPNDTGYYLMYRAVCALLGLSPQQDSATQLNWTEEVPGQLWRAHSAAVHTGEGLYFPPNQHLHLQYSDNGGNPVFSGPLESALARKVMLYNGTVALTTDQDPAHAPFSPYLEPELIPISESNIPAADYYPYLGQKLFAPSECKQAWPLANLLLPPICDRNGTTISGAAHTHLTLAGEIVLPTWQVMPVEESMWTHTFEAVVLSSRLWQFSLFWITVMLEEYDRQPDPAILASVEQQLTWFFKWLDRDYDKLGFGPVPSADHSCAVRTMTMSNVLRAFPADWPLRQQVTALLARDCRWMCSLAGRIQNNHGIIMLEGLLYAANVLKDRPAEEACYRNTLLDHVATVMIDIYDANFDGEGLCRENTIGYHNFNLACFDVLIEVCRQNDLPIDLAPLLQRIERSKEITRQLIWQDSYVPPIGDWYLLALPCSSVNKDHFYRESNWLIRKDNQRYFSYKCGFTLPAHKHVDEGSLTLRYRGRDILVDCGSYNYDRQDPIRQYVESARGHSGLYPKSLYPILAPEYTKSVHRESAIDYYEPSGEKTAAHGYYELNTGFRAERRVEEQVGELLIEDSFRCGAPEDVELRLCLHPDACLVEKCSDRKLLFRNQDVFFSIELLDAVPDGKLELQTGHYSPELQQAFTNMVCVVSFSQALQGEIKTRIRYGTSLSQLVARPTLSRTLHRNHLTAEITPKQEDAASYSFYLYQDGKCIQKQDKISQPKHTFELQEDGIYCVGAEIHRTEGRCSTQLVTPKDVHRMVGKPSLSIYGSCVSRDIFEFTQDDKFELKAYVARQSMISAVAPPLPDGAIPLQNPSQFRMRAVEYDLKKSAFAVLQESKSDYLLIDLIDERFPLLSIMGSLVTASNEFYESTPAEYRSVDKVEKRLKDGKLYLGDVCVEDAVQEFCTRLRQIYDPEQIIIHHATFVDQYLSKSGAQKRFAKHYLAANHRLNAILETMYSRIQFYLPGVYVIRETAGALADENHKWGLAPMHYEVDYYRRVLARLYEIADLAENKG